MCGLVGIFAGNSEPLARRALLEPMLARLQHRGPDAWGTWAGSAVALGHVRLAIVALMAGHQPFLRDDCVLVYNGEVYNHLELRAELEALGEYFQTRSDTEVVLVALRRFGSQALARFNGQFALLFWNARTRTLTAARDRYGVRPLYHLEHQGAVYFASETKAFDAIPNYRRAICPEGLLEHGLLWNTLGTRTVFKGIQSLEAGTAVVFGATESPKTYRYHQLGEGTPHPLPSSFAEAKVHLRSMLANAVRLRLRSDVPVGNYLSGGIDSSVTTLLTDDLRTDRFQAFAIAFEDGAYDESHYQQMMAKRLNVDLVSIRITDALIRDNFEKAVWHAERPLFRTAPIPLLLLAEVVRAAGIRVVLTGEAADEILWGYDTFKELKLLRFWAKFPNSKLRPQLIRTLYPHLAHYRDGRQFGLMRMFYEGFLGSYDNDLVELNLRVPNNKILLNYLPRDCRPADLDGWLLDRVRQSLPPDWQQWSLLRKNQFLEMRTLLQGYLLSSQADRMSLAHGVEGRYPFLDHELLEWLFQLPDQFRLPLLSRKHLLRETFRANLPSEIVDRPKQPYQSPDLKAFFEGGRLGKLMNERLSPDAVAAAGLFDAAAVERFRGKFTRGMPPQVGYRDNMLASFLLSTQVVAAQLQHPWTGPVRPSSPRTVDLIEEGKP